MNYRICYFGILLILILLYVTGCRKAGTWLVKKDEDLHGDILVILLGSISDRVLQAVDLYEDKVAGSILITEGPNDGYRELKARGADMISGTRQNVNAAIDLGIPAGSIIILPGGAQSTQHEALIISEYLAGRPEIDTLILVTSSSHTRRASMIFKNVFRKSHTDVCIKCSPSMYSSFDSKYWWKSKDGIEEVLLEYLKIANFVLFERKR